MLRGLQEMCKHGVTLRGYCSGARYLHSWPFALAQNVVVPSMGDSITEGTVAEIRKGQNDVVEEDEAILTLETDKACCHGELELTHIGVTRKSSKRLAHIGAT